MIVRLLLILCAAHSSVCAPVDPMLLPVPAIACQMQALQQAEIWMVAHPEIVRGRRLGGTWCAPVGVRVGST